MNQRLALSVPQINLMSQFLHEWCGSPFWDRCQLKCRLLDFPGGTVVKNLWLRVHWPFFYVSNFVKWLFIVCKFFFFFYQVVGLFLTGFQWFICFMQDSVVLLVSDTMSSPVCGLSFQFVMVSWCTDFSCRIYQFFS